MFCLYFSDILLPSFFVWGSPTFSLSEYNISLIWGGVNSFLKKNIFLIFYLSDTKSLSLNKCAKKKFNL